MSDADSDDDEPAPAPIPQPPTAVFDLDQTPLPSKTPVDFDALTFSALFNLPQ